MRPPGSNVVGLSGGGSQGGGGGVVAENKPDGKAKTKKNKTRKPDKHKDVYPVQRGGGPGNGRDKPKTRK